MPVGAEPACVLVIFRKYLIIDFTPYLIKGGEGVIQFAVGEIFSFVVIVLDVKQSQSAVFCEKHSDGINFSFIYVFDKHLIIAQLQAISAEGIRIACFIVNHNQVIVIVFKNNVADS